MDFTEMRLKKIAENSFVDIYEGLSNNFYEVKQSPFSEKENNLAKSLQKIIHGSNSLTELSKIKGVSQDLVKNFKDDIVSIIEINGLNEKIPSKAVFDLLQKNLIELISNVSFISDKTISFSALIFCFAVSSFAPFNFASSSDRFDRKLSNSPFILLNSVLFRFN